MVTTAPLDPDQLRTELAEYTGSETWHRHPLNRKVTLTDGATYFAEKAGAHWLMDVFATELPPFVAKHGFASIKADVANRKATLIADDGNGNVFWRKQINYTDCPEGVWEFYMAPGGPGDTTVILLTSEY